MIIVSASITLNHKTVMFPPKIVAKWPNDTNLGFDIYSGKGWYHFLKQYNTNGKFLPNKTKEGIQIVYRAYLWGGGHTLFPGTDAENKKLPVAQYGNLDDSMAPFWDAQK